MSRLSKDFPDLMQVFANHLSASLLAYIGIFYLAQVFAAWVAVYFPQNAAVFYYGLELYPLTTRWLPNAIVYTYMAGPLLCLLLAVAFKMGHYAYFVHQPGYAKTLLLWGFLHGSNQFFGAFIMGVFLRRGLGHSLYWGGVPMPLQVIFAVLALAALVFIGIRSFKYFIATTPYEDLVFVHDFSRWRFIVFAALLPWLATAAIAFLMRYPDGKKPDMVTLLMLGTGLVPMLFVHRYNFRILLHEQEVRGLNRLALLAAVVLGVGLYLFFYNGVEFNSRFGR